jgi:hypothetical protein
MNRLSIYLAWFGVGFLSASLMFVIFFPKTIGG